MEFKVKSDFEFNIAYLKSDKRHALKELAKNTNELVTSLVPFFTTHFFTLGDISIKELNNKNNFFNKVIVAQLESGLLSKDNKLNLSNQYVMVGKSSNIENIRLFITPINTYSKEYCNIDGFVNYNPSYHRKENYDSIEISIYLSKKVFSQILSHIENSSLISASLCLKNIPGIYKNLSSKNDNQLKVLTNIPEHTMINSYDNDKVKRLGIPSESVICFFIRGEIDNFISANSKGLTVMFIENKLNNRKENKDISFENKNNVIIKIMIYLLSTLCFLCSFIHIKSN